MFVLNKQKYSDYLNKEFSINKKSIWLGFLSILLPNIFFLIASFSLGFARPLVDLDYIPALLLLSFSNRYLRILGVILLWIAIIFDVLMLAMQIFPFADISAIIYLAPFILDAPLRYLVSVIFVGIYLIIFPILLIKFLIRKKIHPIIFIFYTSFSFAYYHLFAFYIFYKDVPAQFFGHHNYYVAHSQISLYLANHGTGFITALNSAPTLIKGQDDRAIEQLEKPYNHKILFIVAESWGQAREERVTRAILEKIYEKEEKLEFIEQGFFDFSGATVQGELRELCYLNIEQSSGFGLSKSPTEDFVNCLPNKLKHDNYHTVSMHGAGRMLYDRYDWYPKAGFTTTYFSEDFLDRKRCSVFKGICDSALLDVVAKEFSQHEKTFFYWLTLTSHASWSEKDMVNPRLDCKAYDLFEGDICNSFRLHAQFFDDLSTLIDLPEMKGVEVVVVGDHMPPVITTKPLHKNLRWNDVAWLHFKIKE